MSSEIIGFLGEMRGNAEEPYPGLTSTMCPNPKKFHFPYIKNWYDYVILVANVRFRIKYGSRLASAVYAGRKITSLET